MTFLTHGDHAPLFRTTDHKGRASFLGSAAGNVVVLYFYPKDDTPTCTTQAQTFRDNIERFTAQNIEVIGISPDNAASHDAFRTKYNLPFAFWTDEHKMIAKKFGIVEGDRIIRTTFLIDQNSRIVKRYHPQDMQAHVEELLLDAKTYCIKPEPRIISEAHPPVLYVPNVMPKSFCDKLIHVWHERGNEDSARMIEGESNLTVPVIDYGFKKRRDHFITDKNLQQEVDNYVAGRAFPEMDKAFHFPPTRREQYKIACYNGEDGGGYFSKHRDNTSAGVMHRRYAMSLALNNEFEGGGVYFPEYNNDVYNPKAGDAVIFSCSLMHEALPVTKGKRFVLLSFFYGEEDAKKHAEYVKRHMAAMAQQNQKAES